MALFFFCFIWFSFYILKSFAVFITNELNYGIREDNYSQALPLTDI